MNLVVTKIILVKMVKIQLVTYLKIEIKTCQLKDLIHPNSKKAEGIEDNLLTNINEWMKEISPGINLEFSSDQKIRASSMSAVYYSSTLFNKVTPKNFGFGISYCLPIITLLLTSKKMTLFS
ncbi:hypothetical protein ECENHK_00585 [Enterobacter kobei]|nr:hypothetical protein ECENHK_00585 [Enterobacter kobei]